MAHPRHEMGDLRSSTRRLSSLACALCSEGLDVRRPGVPSTQEARHRGVSGIGGSEAEGLPLRVGNVGRGLTGVVGLGYFAS
jgi:hypothetical protein